jgi:hypothetical protein
VDEVVPVTETTGAARGLVSTGSVTVTMLLDSRPLESSAHMTNEYILPGDHVARPRVARLRLRDADRVAEARLDHVREAARINRRPTPG